VASKPADKSQDKVHDKAPDKAPDKVHDKAHDKATDAQRAQALLDGKPAAKPVAASAAGNARIVVQAGAYTDAAKLREARAKVEKLGFKTYTQVVEGEGGKRTRVRVGPFATKAEADKAAAKLRAAGLQANLLAL
jgi:DedD protein